MSSKKFLATSAEELYHSGVISQHDGLVERLLAAQRTCWPFDLGMARDERAFGSRQRAEGESSGEPDLRQLEPDCQLAPTAHWPSRGCVTARWKSLKLKAEDGLA